MHSAHRSVRILKPGVRSSATAAKTALKAPDKWSIQQPVQQQTAPLAKLSKIPLSPSSGTSPQIPLNPLSSRNWPRRSDSRSTARSSSPSISSPRRPNFGKWGIQPPTTPANASSSKLGREGAPHLAPKVKDGLPELKAIRKILNRDKVSYGTEGITDRKLPTTENQKEKHRSSASTLDSRSKQLQEVEHEEPATFTTSQTRSSKKSKINFKERGSIASRLNQGVDISIPHYARVKTAAAAGKGKEKEKKTKLRMGKPVQVDVYIPTVVSVGHLARLLNIRLDTLQRKMVKAGMSEEASYDHILTSEYASLLAMEFNRNPIVNDEAAFDILPPSPPSDKSALPVRPPVVTIMGHVDHGKTTLLDTLRSASVAKGEAGGITQHIGAFSVPVATSGSEKRTITFLDTPGHAAFSAMRARGASVTDIVVLVVAADDGIMPQTKEVLELVKKDEGNVGLVVAINKVDKPGVDVDAVEKALLAEGVQLETFGGDVPCVHVSGLTGLGLDSLIETISVVAELQDLRGEQEGPCQGYVLESKMQKGLGPVATVLLLRGTLKPGQHLICGTAQGKVRVLTCPAGSAAKTVLPGTAAVVSGWKELPLAGDEVLQGSEADVKRAITNRLRVADMKSTLEDLEALNASRREERDRKEAEENKGNIEEGDEIIAKGDKDQKKFLNLVIKGDVSGSVEAVAGALEGIGNNLVGVKIVTSGVGDVSENDIMRAKTAEGMIVAFSVNIPRSLESTASRQGVQILNSAIIYQLMDKVKECVIGLLPKVVEKRVTGEATVLQLFDIHKKAKQIMKVAGCRVTNGMVEKSRIARVIRNGESIYEGQLDTLRHQKKDITEANKGTECGLSIQGFDDLREGDLIQMYHEIEKAGTL